MFGGWHLTRRDVLKDFYLDDFGLECFASNLHSHVAEIARALRLGEYRFAERRPISIPKGSYGTRPGSILTLRDRVVLWSLVSLLIPVLDRKLHDGVRSYRLKPAHTKDDLFEEVDDIVVPFLKGSYINHRISPFSPWHYNWREFDKLSKEAYKNGYRYAAVTDISAYFENIHLDILRDLLLEHLPTEQKVVNLLVDALRGWTVETARGTRPRRGIPQGTGVSSFLGNVFLMPVDNALNPPNWTEDTIYLRYVDDIRVFSKTKLAASKAILTLEEELRRIHLSVQTAKTEVLDANQIRSLLYDDRIDQILSVRSIHPSPAIASGVAIARLNRIGSSVPAGGEALNKRFGSRTGLPERATRMWMNSLMYYNSPSYVPLLTHVITKNADPRYSEILIRSAKKFPTYGFSTTKMYSYLDGPENIFEYHECAILESFRYMNLRSTKIFQRCFDIIRGPSSYSIKLAAIRYLAKWCLGPIQLNEIARLQRQESHIPCLVGYLQILGQLNAVDFSWVMRTVGRIPSPHGVDAMEFVSKVQSFTPFTKRFLSFVFDRRYPFRLCDWIGVLWIVSHTKDSKLRKHLDGLARRRELVEKDTLLLSALKGVRARLI